MAKKRRVKRRLIFFIKDVIIILLIVFCAMLSNVIYSYNLAVEYENAFSGVVQLKSKIFHTKNAFVEENGQTYFYVDGDMKTGWKTIKNELYYFDESGVMAVGKKTIDGNTYYFNKEGNIKSGLIQGTKYYYYFSPENYRMVTGFVKIDDHLYYFKENGTMHTGWLNDEGKTYYFYENGPQIGQAAVGKVTINHVTYTFEETGEVNNKDAIDMDVKAKAYASNTDYLILVNKNTHYVGIYQGEKNNWTRIKYFPCSTGADTTVANTTPIGSFTVGPGNGLPCKRRYFDDAWGSRCWYATRFNGPILFHSVPYLRDPEPTMIEDGRLGYSISHGCVRLQIDNAKWIYKNIPEKTKVIVYQ